ncbi:M15 family metallopeptidase [Propionicimonas paludicola]|uniref:M15 family metallopeptidase n=1 Tax=Propionicimonas paludicola TaxID=185243 RepID=UPI000BF9DDE4|nr:M15 family metallopeptidase [Propionicimonas paludicola]
MKRAGIALVVACLLAASGCAAQPPSAGPARLPSSSAGASSPVAPVISATPTSTPTVSASPTPSETPTGSATPSAPAKDTRTGAQLNQPYRVDGVIVVSKAHPVSANYRPPRPTGPYGLNADAQQALAKMTAAAKKDGVKLVVRSGYRSYATQKQVYNNALRNYPSITSAKRYNAPPGASEHQTGLAMDLWDGVTWSLPMANTATGKWLHKHCHEYGFVLRYPKGKEKLTGYAYEPWHFRYLGTTLAARFGSGNTLTLEEVLGLA